MEGEGVTNSRTGGGGGELKILRTGGAEGGGAEGGRGPFLGGGAQYPTACHEQVLQNHLRLEKLLTRKMEFYGGERLC